MSTESTGAVLVLDKEIVDLLEDIAVEEGIGDYTIAKTGGSEKGDGYGSVITSVTISGKDKENKKKNVNLIVKSVKQGDALRAVGDMAGVFQREIFIYTTLFEAYNRLEMEKGLVPSPLGPKFYKGTMTHKNETFILENLRHSGYKLYERRIPMDENHVELTLKAYGRLHALSFALRDQKRQEFEKSVGSMDDLFTKAMVETDLKHMFIQKCVQAQEALDPETDAEAVKVYGKFVKSIEQFFGELLVAVDEYSVALHGDCWTNNMMFKYEDPDDETKPTNVSFIDFQCSRMASPVLDVSYFFYACGSKKIISNLGYYLQLYYDAFSKYLRKLGSDPEKLYPFYMLQQHWERYARYGLIFSMLVIHVMLTEKDETIDISDVAESGKLTTAFGYKIANTDAYNVRVRDVILHFVEKKLLQC